MSEYRQLRKRIKTNIRQARTSYKVRQIYYIFLNIANGQFTKRTMRKCKKILLGLPKYTVDQCIKI